MAIIGSRSNFPNSLDTNLPEYVDLSPSEVISAQRWNVLKLQPTRSSAEEVEFNTLTTQLSKKIFSCETLNTLSDCVYRLEEFFLSETVGYLTTKQAEWNAILQKFSDKGNWTGTVTYQMWNTVQYNYETYLSKVDNNLNHTPFGGVSDNYWQKIASRGNKGDAGIGLSFCGLYDNARTYQVGNAVNYNNSIYYCISISTGNLPTNTTYWTLFMTSNTIVSSEIPQNPNTGTIWIDTSI